MSQKFITCADCGGQEAKRGTGHKFCEACGRQRHLARHREYAAKVYPDRKSNMLESDRKRDGLLRAAAVERSNAAATSISDIFREVEPEWVVRTHVPYTWVASKNAFVGRPGISCREARDMQIAWQSELTARVKRAIEGIEVKQNKVWLDIFVQKDSAKSDAVNVIDIVCDGVKDAIGVDDKWFCIRRLDWEIVKGEPRIYVGISQEKVDDAQACSYCGVISPLSAFGVHKANKNGRARVCSPCKSESDVEDRRRRKATTAGVAR